MKQSTLAIAIALIFGGAALAGDDPRIELRYGAPTPDVLDRPGYLLAYSQAWRSPKWVLYHLDASHFKMTRPRSAFGFHVDRTLPGLPVSARSAGVNGWQRGHLKPYAASEGLEDAGRALAEAASCMLVPTNVVWQTAESNTGVWRRLEAHTQDLALAADVWVAVGPLWAPQRPRGDGDDIVAFHVIGDDARPAPTHLWKSIVVVRDGDLEQHSWIVVNSHDPPASFNRCAVTTDELERSLSRCFGETVDLWSRLPDALETELESK